jgi:hypothetical protein
MNLQGFVAVIGGVVGLIGGICGILSWLNQRKQTAVLQGQLDVMQKQFQTVKRQEENATECAKKFDQATNALMKISPNNTLPAGPSGTIVDAYRYIFPNEDLRFRIETYLGRRKIFIHTFRPATLTNDQLQNPVVKQTIQDVLDIVELFKRDHTDFARALKLLPPK